MIALDNDDESNAVPAGEMHFCNEDWRCAKHGRVSAVLHMRLHEDEDDHTYCMHCLREAFEALGLQRLESM